jgi:protein O-GlcNAc transferase
MRSVVLLLISALLTWGAENSPERIFQEAARALAAGNYEAAEQGFRRVLKIQPAHVGALGNLGTVYSRTDRIPDAISVYRRALKIAPDEPGLLLNLGLAYLKKEDYAAAKPLIARVNRSPLASDQSKELLATCQLFTGEVKTALATLETLPRSPGVLFLLGLAYTKTNDKAKAEAAFRELLTSAATQAQAHFLIGKAYAESTLFDQAASELKQSADLDPALPGLQLELGKVLISLRDHEGAEKALRRALEQKPGDAEALYYLGAMLMLDGRRTEAIPLLQRARAARPDGWGSYYYLGRAELQAKNAPAAIALLEKAAKLNPDESSIQYQLVRAYQLAGMPAAANRARARLAALRQEREGADERIHPNRTQQ